MNKSPSQLMENGEKQANWKTLIMDGEYGCLYTERVR